MLCKEPFPLVLRRDYLVRPASADYNALLLSVGRQTLESNFNLLLIRTQVPPSLAMSKTWHLSRL